MYLLLRSYQARAKSGEFAKLAFLTAIFALLLRRTLPVEGFMQKHAKRAQLFAPHALTSHSRAVAPAHPFRSLQ
jgi:hypothetical protein